ncbi:MAG: hypothetical protein R3D55_03505 [Chloroflexota bacterium]
MNLMFYLGVQQTGLAEEFFVKPFSYLWTVEGVAVDRKAANGMVGQTVATIQQRAKLCWRLRRRGHSKVERWHFGFYHIAHGANIPIVRCWWITAVKPSCITEPFIPTGDVDTDLPLLQARFKGIRGKNQTHF